MSVPELRIPLRVDGTEAFQRDMDKTRGVVTGATLAITKQVIAMNAGFLASQGASGAATLAFGRMLGVLGPIALGIPAIKDTFDFLRYSVKLASERIEEFNGIATNAASANVTSDFFQRMSKSAATAGLTVDDVTESLKRFNSASGAKLGGSDLDQRLKELRDAGNFDGNSGLALLQSATTTEQKLRAVSVLIDEAMQKGERLAALDIADNAFGSKVTDNLKSNAGYLDQMLQRADAIGKTQIISPEDVGRAIELKQRMEESHKILAEKWKPVQNDIAELGINFKNNWVSVVEVFAEIVGLANTLYSVIKSIPDLLSTMGNAPFWNKLTEFTGAMGLNSNPEALGLVGIDADRGAANAKLRTALQDRANMIRSMQQATDVQSAVRGDTSKVPEKAGGKTDYQVDAFETASNTLEKHTARMKADTDAVGLGAGALEELRGRATLLTAAQQAGIPVTAEVTARIEKLAKAAGEAGEELAKAKVNSEIGFGRSTALLSSEDVQIASQLKTVYGNDVPAALNSSEASAMRLNNALKGMASTIETNLTTGLADVFDGTKSVGAGFADMGRIALRALEEMVIKMAIVQPLMRSMSGIFGFADGGPVSAVMVGDYAMPKFAGGGEISGPGTGRSDSILARVSDGEFIVNATSTAKHRALVEAINADRLPRYADGGLVAGGSSTPIGGAINTTTIAPTIQVSVQGSPGASPADHEKMGATIARSLETQVKAMISKELRTQTRPGGILSR